MPLQERLFLLKIIPISALKIVFGCETDVGAAADFQAGFARLIRPVPRALPQICRDPAFFYFSVSLTRCIK